MIISQARNVVTLLQQYGQLLKDRKLNEQLQGRANELKAAADKLEEPAKRVALQREREWLKKSPLPTEEVEKHEAMIAELRDLLRKEPGKIDPSVNRLVKSCDSVARKADKQTDDAWTKVVKRRQPSVAEAELTRCEQFTSECATVEEIRRLTKFSVAQAPSSREALHEIENRWDRLSELIGSLPKSSDNPEVNRFLDAVNKGGAPLDLLTDSVRRYLEETGKAKLFRIYQER